MKNRAVPIAFLAPVIVSLLAACSSAQVRAGDFDIGESDHIAPPRLIEPSTDAVDLSGRDCLEFRWSPFEGDPIRREYYELKIYKGRQAYAAARIYMARVPPRQWAACVSSWLFEDGQAYTVTLRQAYRGAKSRRTFQSFTVVKSRRIPDEGPQ
jgi:hypothetical protein